jgi:hypothetical protein
MYRGSRLFRPSSLHYKLSVHPSLPGAHKNHSIQACRGCRAVNPPHPHPHLEVTTRAFYGNHNALLSGFWAQCHHGDDIVVQIYKHFGMPDAASLGTHTTWFDSYIILVLQFIDTMLVVSSETPFYSKSVQNNECGFTYWIDGPMELHLQEYICHLHILNQHLEQENYMKHNQINQLLHENEEHARRVCWRESPAGWRNAPA